MSKTIQVSDELPQLLGPDERLPQAFTEAVVLELFRERRISAGKAEVVMSKTVYDEERAGPPHRAFQIWRTSLRSRTPESVVWWGDSKPMQHWPERISIDPHLCHGNVCIKGTHIKASVGLDNLAEGLLLGEIVEKYPRLTPDDVRPAMAYAATFVGQESARCPRSAAFGGS